MQLCHPKAGICLYRSATATSFTQPRQRKLSGHLSIYIFIENRKAKAHSSSQPRFSTAPCPTFAYANCPVCSCTRRKAQLFVCLPRLRERCLHRTWPDLLPSCVQVGTDRDALAARDQKILLCASSPYLHPIVNESKQQQVTQ